MQKKIIWSLIAQNLKIGNINETLNERKDLESDSTRY